MLAISYQAALREPLLAADEERDAICKWQDDRDPRALERLLRSHARQVWSQAARWTDNPAHLEDLVSEGFIGLIRAADNFDRAMDVRFSTYAVWWVRNGVSNALARTKHVIDIPARTYLDHRSGRLSAEEARLAQLAMSGTLALDAPLHEDGLPLSDLLASSDLTPEEEAEAASLSANRLQALEEALETLDPIDREIIRRRKLQVVPESLDSLSQSLDTSRDRLRQLERRALNRLRQRLVLPGAGLLAAE